MFCVTETADTGTSRQPPLLLLSLYTPREGRGLLFSPPSEHYARMTQYEPTFPILIFRWAITSASTSALHLLSTSALRDGISMKLLTQRIPRKSF